MSLKNIARALRSQIRRLLPFRPARYWEERHSACRGALAAAGHASLSEEDNARNYRQKNEKLVEVIQATFASKVPATVLDLGCGTGNCFPAYQQLGLAIIGVDFSQTAITEARRKCPEAKLSVGGPSDVAGEFHLICCVDVLFHVVADSVWEKFLLDATRRMAVNGFLIIQEHLVSDEAYRGVEEYCHFRRLRDYQAVLDRLGLVLHNQVSYFLTIENTTKDILVLRRASS